MQMCDWGLIQQSIISSNCQPILNTALSLPLMVQSNSCTDELFRPQPWPHQQTGQTGRLCRSSSPDNPIERSDTLGSSIWFDLPISMGLP